MKHKARPVLVLVVHLGRWFGGALVVVDFDAVVGVSVRLMVEVTIRKFEVVELLIKKTDLEHKALLLLHLRVVVPFVLF